MLWSTLEEKQPGTLYIISNLSPNSHLTSASKDISTKVESATNWISNTGQDFGIWGLLIKITKRLNSVPLKNK